MTPESTQETKTVIDSGEFRLERYLAEAPARDQFAVSEDSAPGDLEHELKPELSHRVLGALLEISYLVGSRLAIDQILRRITEVTAATMAVPCSSIYLWNDDRSRLVMRSNVGFSPALVGVAGFDRGRGIPGWVAENGRIIALEDATRDERYDPLPDTLEHRFHAYLCAPLKIGDESIGVMTVRKNEAVAFTPDEITIYITICKQVANVIDLARVTEARIEAERLAAVAVSLSGVAHYIKNVLLTLRGGEYLVDAALKRGQVEQAAEGWKLLKRSTRKISALVENMLSYYQQTEIRPRPIELNNVILDVLANLEDRAAEAHTVLTPNLDLRVELAELDPDAIQDVLINLLSNAIDAIPAGRSGLVHIRTQLDPAADSVELAVADNGTGVLPEHRDKLFALFFTTKGRKGTGIGLAATRKLIQDHGGTIAFSSEPDKGTEFKIRLPLRQPKLNS